jgi:hypothetical protein
MKQLTFKLIIPLTVISFTTVTKWWYALPVDAPDTIFTGFPFPFVCAGWHTSMSLQIFVTELIADFLAYFLFWLLVIYGLNRFITKINPHKVLTLLLWTLTGLILCGAGFIAFDANNIYHIKRPYDMEIMETGYHLIWQQIERPDYYKYHPEERK